MAARVATRACHHVKQGDEVVILDCDIADVAATSTRAADRTRGGNANAQETS